MSAISRDHGAHKPRGANRGPDEPAVGSTGWKFAAPQPVILKERPSLPRMKDLNWRSPLCSPLPASFSQRPHPPIALCCKQKPNLNSTARSTERSKPFFVFFSGPIRFNFSLLFPFLLSGRQRVASCPKARGAPIAAPQTVIVSDRRMPGPQQARFSLVVATGSRTIQSSIQP